jgi:hypothetical protein
MGLPKFAEGPAAYAAESRRGLAEALRDAKAARLSVPRRGEHVRRLLFGFTAPFTVLRLGWRDASARRSMRERLLPPVLCLVAALVVAVCAEWTSKHGQEPDDGWTSILLYRLLAVLAALGVVEWILVWIGREHHDAVAYECSVLTGAPAEPLPRPPSLRLDPIWVGMKAWRAVRFGLFLGLVAPFAWLVGMVPHLGRALSIVIEGAWAAYWASVFAVANSFVAWEAKDAPRRPWFVRTFDRAGRVVLIGLLVRPYARLVAWVTLPVWPACAAFEEAPWESAGLALARGVAGVPVLYLVVRPFFGPAATHALVGRRAFDAVPSSAANPPAPAPPENSTCALDGSH